MQTSTVAVKRGQTRVEELANTLSHGFGLLAALAATPALILQGMDSGNTRFLVGVAVFCTTMITLYFSSTVYHGLRRGKSKNLFRIIEHSAIFLLIAGTYTPFTLGVLQGSWGWTLFGIIWSLALVGVTLKALQRANHPVFSTGLYLAMGWVIVIAIEPMLDRVETEGLLLLLAGGLFYTVGVVFFTLDSRIRFGHFIWHLFVLSGTACHYFAIFWYAA